MPDSSRIGMKGAAGRDPFVLAPIHDCRLAALATSSSISLWDRIDVSAIDADLTKPGLNPFMSLLASQEAFSAPGSSCG
jgi:hypothetical protein